jgi:hypothetical protein|tara:strand:+ start:350 stop:619 length:270 start_codon:yes stop_codon:yes gene_type:complete
MKITKTELRELIKEELDSAMEEDMDALEEVQPGLMGKRSSKPDYDYIYRQFFQYLAGQYQMPGKTLRTKLLGALQYSITNPGKLPKMRE